MCYLQACAAAAGPGPPKPGGAERQPHAACAELPWQPLLQHPACWQVWPGFHDATCALLAATGCLCAISSALPGKTATQALTYWLALQQALEAQKQVSQQGCT